MKYTKIVVSHPTGNANVREVVKGMKKANLLAVFYTSIAVFPESFLFKIGSKGTFKELLRRGFDPIIQSDTQMIPWMETGRLLASKLGFKKLIKHETGFFSIDSIYKHNDKIVASQLSTLKDKKSITSVYAYEDGALQTFKRAKTLGLKCIYELPIGYWKSARLLMIDEYDKNPDWSSTLTGFNDSESKLENKDQELALADVIYVASTFTKKTLEDYSGSLSEIKVIPYGFPEINFKKEYQPLQGRKLKILFVGGLSQRKGISYLFEAVRELKDSVQLTVVGHKAVPNCTALNEALEQHNYIPSMSHDQVLQCMREHDVFVFPSLFEGFGLVITEAMSQGIPVITTDRTAGPDLITNGVDGWIVPAGSSAAIQDVLYTILDNPKLVEQVGLAAQSKAKTRPWSVYGQEMAISLSK